jgi:hypothetical protein
LRSNLAIRLFIIYPNKILQNGKPGGSFLSENFIAPQFKIISQGEHFELQCRFNINGAAQPVTDNECNNSILFLYNHTFTVAKTGRCNSGRKIYQEWQYQTD